MLLIPCNPRHWGVLNQILDKKAVSVKAKELAERVRNR
jgi:hypothetical protein